MHVFMLKVYYSSLYSSFRMRFTTITYRDARILLLQKFHSATAGWHRCFYSWFQFTMDIRVTQVYWRSLLFNLTSPHNVAWKQLGYFIHLLLIFLFVCIAHVVDYLLSLIFSNRTVTFRLLLNNIKLFAFSFPLSMSYFKACLIIYNQTIPYILCWFIIWILVLD